MTSDKLYDTGPDEASAYASIHPYARGTALLVRGGLVVSIDKIEEAVEYLKSKRTVDLIQVYIYKHELRVTIECGVDSTHYAWDDLVVTHCRTNTGTWETLASDALEKECPGAVSPEERANKYKALILAQYEEQQKVRAALAHGLMGVSAPPPEEGDPN